MANYLRNKEGRGIMKEKYFCDTPSARMLEFDNIIEQLTHMACTQKAREQLTELSPSITE